MEWVWYRFEYQSRGTVHIHGGSRLRSDPGLTELGEIFVSGKLALRVLSACLDVVDLDVLDNEVMNEINSLKRCYNIPLNERNSEEPSATINFDVFNQPLQSIKDKYHNEFMNEATRATVTLKYFDMYKEGKLAETKICRYRDYLLTTNHPDPPIDHNKDDRDLTTKFVQNETFCHPCSTNSLHNISQNAFVREKAYSDLCSFANRHW